MKVFHIDSGRKYFALHDLKEIVDILPGNGYDYIEVAFGNGGMRYMLDDMTVETKEKVYESEEVKAAINFGNKKYYDCGVNELTETEMTDFVSYCKERGIGIIPLLNTPGHMDAIVRGMEELGIQNVRYAGSNTTIDLGNEDAVSFTCALVLKYVKWFEAKGSKYFNMGCDEYANDVLTSGFESLCSGDGQLYERFIRYANNMAEAIISAGMKPVMFNDGFYYNCIVPKTGLNTEIICSFWTGGWPGYNTAPAKFIEDKGHKILNTNCDWYYVLGRRVDSKDAMFNNEASMKGIKTINKGEVIGGICKEVLGDMICLWCDEPYACYDDNEKKIIFELLKAF